MSDNKNIIAKTIEESRKIVIKLGSNTLADKEGKINTRFLDEFAGQAAALMKKGKQIAIVSSGAQVAGLSTMGKWARKKDLHYRQALCAVGQVELMWAWRKAFDKAGIHIAQILLTREDFEDNKRTLNMRNTIFTLIDEGIIPIINENDSVSVEEIKIGDNDNLASLSAILWSADLLILFSDIDGLYNKNPKEFSDASLVPEVDNIAEIGKLISTGSTNDFGTGGMETKLEAARRAIAYNIPTIIAHGGREHALQALASGTQQGTIIKG